MSNRRVFTREYKLAAIKKIIEQGLNFVVAAREMGISDSALRAWKKEFELNGTLQNQLSQSPSVEADFHLELLTLEIDATCDRQMVLVQPDRCRCRKTLPTQDVSIEGVRSQMGWMDRAGAVDDCRSNKALPSLQVLSSS